MRTLIAIVIATMLVGCSDRPDLTEEQLDALQVLGEMQPDSDHYRQAVAADAVAGAAAEAVHARGKIYRDAYEACEPGSAERREAKAKELSFAIAENSLILEYLRRRKIDGTQAADWYVAEIEKSDTQIIEDWYKRKLYLPPKG